MSQRLQEIYFAAAGYTRMYNKQALIIFFVVVVFQY